MTSVREMPRLVAVADAAEFGGHSGRLLQISIGTAGGLYGNSDAAMNAR